MPDNQLLYNHRSNSIDLTFHCAELPHIHIEKCVSLYNTGLYEDLLLRNIDNKIGSTGAFHAAKKVPNFICRPNKWKRRSYCFNNSAHTAVPFNKLISASNRRYSSLLHHLQPDKDLPMLPLQYFVGITHSGHSITPYRNDCWAKHSGREELSERLNPDDYHLSISAVCSADNDALQRVERAEELGTHPLKAFCCNGRRKRNSVEEEEMPKIGAIIHLKSRIRTSVNTDEYPSTTAYSGQYEILRPTDDLKQTNIEEFISGRPCADVAIKNADDLYESQHKQNNNGSKKKATIFVRSSRSEDVAAAAVTFIVNDLQKEKSQLDVYQLRLANELKTAPLDSCIEKQHCEQQQQQSVNGKKLTAKIFFKSFHEELQYDASTTLQNDGQPETKVLLHGQKLHSLSRKEELKCCPIEAFVTATAELPVAKRIVDVNLQPLNGQKFTANIAIKSSQNDEQRQQHDATPQNNEPERNELHALFRDEELKCQPIEEFVTTTPYKFWQQIGAKKDKKKKRMKKKRKHLSGQKSASASSSSSSSSSSDTEAEEIHVLVHDEEHHQQKMPEKITEAANFRTIESMDADGGAMALPSHTTTVRTWHEQSTGPQHVTTEVDEHGNMIRRVVTTEHVKHTVQTHSYQTASVDDDGIANVAAAVNNNTAANNNDSNVMVAAVAKSPPPVPPARRRGSSTTTMPQAQMDVGVQKQQEQLTVGKNVTFENGVEQKRGNVSGTGGQPSEDDVGELVSTKLVTTGNRTIETLTYKKEADGMVETRVEHRITIHANEEIDHDAELDRAISEATKMNPNMKVEKVEVERSSS
uniref:4_1_CTD domain-containing protein n=1 Tax=Globodera pallida TaxID=36090 RepID=A0A183CL22_GLOPA